MGAYYNEHDRFAADWLRELIKAGLIAPGDVDERDIREVQPGDLKGYSQCHFFAGIGVWSYALRAAGWPDDSAVWTGSCPCQSFSASGQRGGFSDQRHLWPAWFRLIGECRPHTVFGEQVASNDGLAWFDLVSADMEGAGYTIGAADTCAAGFGAPHIRQRLYFVADAERDGGRADLAGRGAQGREADGWDSEAGSVADAYSTSEHERPSSGEQPVCGLLYKTAVVELGHAASFRRGLQHRECDQRTDEGRDENGQFSAPCLTNGFWRGAEWLWCRDGKYRPAEPGTFPLAHGAAKRVGRLRGYGNALCAPQAKAFIRAYRETIGA